MAETAYQAIYRREWINGFERDQALLKGFVTTETLPMDNGARTAYFITITSSREAVTRGANGLIPASADDKSQPSVTLNEYHDLPQMTRYNIFAGQSNQREAMQVTSRYVINRHIDDLIVAALNTGTVVANATASLITKSIVNKATTFLWNAKVKNDGMVYGALTPSAWAALSDLPDFANNLYVETKPLVQGAPSSTGAVEVKKWMGVNWVMHTGLPGAGTSAAKCFIWHKSAVGYAYNDLQALAGYNEEQDYSWARTSVYDGAVKIQNSGIVVINHDDSIYST